MVTDGGNNKFVFIPSKSLQVGLIFVGKASSLHMNPLKRVGGLERKY